MNKEIILVLIFLILLVACVAVKFRKELSKYIKRMIMLKNMTPDERQAYLEFESEQKKRGDE